MVEPGQPALARVVETFGADVLQADGRLDRRRLREHVFADADARHRLEAILHPAIREHLAVQCRNAAGPYAIAAIPLLTEVGGRAAYPWLDRILLVDAPVELQHARLMRRDAQQGILLNIVVGIVGAMIAGFLFSGGSINGAITLRSFLLSLLGAVILLGIVNLFTRKSVR